MTQEATTSSFSSKKLWALAKYAFKESFLDAMMQQMGSNQARLQEQLGRSKNYLKNQAMAMEIVIAVYSIVLIAFPIQTFLKISAGISQGIPVHWALLIGTLMTGLFFLLQVAFMIIFGMLQAGAIVNGESFKWLATLPVSEKDLEKVVLFTFIREVRTQLIVLFFVFPIGTAIGSQNVWMTLIAFGISFINLLFGFSFLVIIGEKINRTLFENDINTGKATVIRIATILGMGLGSMVVVLVVEFSLIYIDQIFVQPPIYSSWFDILNIVLSIIPFPFGGNYLLTAILIHDQIPPMLWISSIVGVILFIKLTWSMTNRALKTLRNIIYQEQKKFIQDKIETKPPAIVSTTPIKAFMKKDLSICTREYQSMMFLIMPLILPLIGLFAVSFGSGGDTAMVFEDRISMVLVLGMIYIMIGAVMLITGLLSNESSGASTAASLPIVIRDQAMAKFGFVLIECPIAVMIFTFAIFDINHIWEVLGLFIIMLPLGPIYALIALLLKVRMFGKMKHGYILEDINFEYKIVKWVLLFVIEIALSIVAMIGSFVLLELGMNYLFLGFLIPEVILSVLLYIVFNRMFPHK